MRIKIGTNLAHRLDLEFHLGNPWYWYAIDGNLKPGKRGGVDYHHVEVGIDWLLDRHPQLMACVLRGDDVLELRSPFAAGDRPCKPD